MNLTFIFNVRDVNDMSQWQICQMDELNLLPLLLMHKFVTWWGKDVIPAIDLIKDRRIMSATNRIQKKGKMKTNRWKQQWIASRRGALRFAYMCTTQCNKWMGASFEAAAASMSATEELRHTQRRKNEKSKHREKKIKSTHRTVICKN